MLRSVVMQIPHFPRCCFSACCLPFPRYLHRSIMRSCFLSLRNSLTASGYQAPRSFATRLLTAAYHAKPLALFSNHNTTGWIQRYIFLHGAGMISRFCWLAFSLWIYRSGRDYFLRNGFPQRIIPFLGAFVVIALERHVMSLSSYI
jgi:hypothetical protein